MEIETFLRLYVPAWEKCEVAYIPIEAYILDHLGKLNNSKIPLRH